MQFLKFVKVFTNNNFLQLRRKWKSLPLLLLFPFLLIGLVAFIFISYFTNLEDDPLQIGLVDLDQSSETEMVIKLMEESSQLGSFLQMKQFSEDEAKQKIKQDELVAYILFPDEFTSKLYNGESIVVTVVGNPKRQMESYLIKELVDSAARHISSSQASILTINYYAKQFNIDAKTRNQIVQEQFNEFLLYVISKDNALDQNLLSNNATTSPKEYFGIAAGFFILTVWIVTIYHMFTKEQSKEIQTRMMLYGVTELQQIIARIIITSIFTIIIGMLLFIGIIHLLHLDIIPENYIRLFTLISLYNITYLFTLAIIEAVISSMKLRLLIQIILTGMLLLVSGSLIPDIYLPFYIQDYLDSVYANQTFYWLEEILLNGRVYIDYTPLLITASVGILATIGFSLWKERVKL
jgi:ABC-2 type transport system permease protein